MSFEISENWPDTAFPMLTGLGHQPLVRMPESGNGIVQQCKACGREVLFTGRDLCRLFPTWLTRDVWAWAAAMKCDDCPSPRQAFHCIRDNDSQGFHRGPRDPVEAQALRRLMEWLPLGGLRLDDVAYLIRADPIKIREAGFEEDVVMLFTSPYSSTHYHPTRQPARAVVPSSQGPVSDL